MLMLDPTPLARGLPGKKVEVVNYPDGRFAIRFGAAQRFFRSARSVAGFVPDRVTTDGHNSYPRAIRSTLGRRVRHRTSVYLNNRLEQDHRGIKGRIRCMRGFKEHEAADRFSREHDELRNFLRSRTRHNQYIPAAHRRRHCLHHARIAICIMQIA